MVGLILTILLSLPIQDTVTATTYKLTARENGPYGNHLASGFKASYKHPGLDRVIAVSPDLLDSFPFHTYVIVKGAGKLDGIWKVEDVMNKRFTKRIDFLIGWKTKPNKFNNVIIKSYVKRKSHIRHHKRRSNVVHHVRTKHQNKRLKKRSKNTQIPKRKR